MTIVFLGIDLAKNVFALHGVDRAGKAVLVRPAVRRDQLLETVAKLLPCTIEYRAAPDKRSSLESRPAPMLTNGHASLRSLVTPSS